MKSLYSPKDKIQMLFSKKVYERGYEASSISDLTNNENRIKPNITFHFTPKGSRKVYQRYVIIHLNSHASVRIDDSDSLIGALGMGRVILEDTTGELSVLYDKNKNRELETHRTGALQPIQEGTYNSFLILYDVEIRRGTLLSADTSKSSGKEEKRRILGLENILNPQPQPEF